jgi:hypothetical protein
MTSDRNLWQYLLRASERQLLMLLICFFVVSRILLYNALPFEFDAISYFMQFLDPELLKGDLVDAILHLHTQPPLHNLMVGLFLKLVPEEQQSRILASIYFLISLTIVISVYWLLCRSGVRSWLAVFITGSFSLFPTLIWIERQPSYVLPIMASLVIMTVALQRYVQTQRPVFGGTFVMLAIYLPLTRSFFHLLAWTLPVLLGFLLVVRKTDRRHVRQYAAVGVCGVALVATFYLSNALKYGSFTGSTWQGMNLAAAVTFVPQEKIEDLVNDGQITPISLIPRFSSPTTYYRYYDRIPSREHAAVDDTTKSTGAINWNNRIYAEAARDYQRNTLTIARAHPFYTFIAFVNQAYLFCGISGYHFFYGQDRWWIPRTDKAVHFIFDIGKTYAIPLLIFMVIAGALLQFVFVLRETVRVWPLSFNRDPLLITNLFVGGVIVYVIVVSCVGELGEGHFMRAQIDPLLAVSVGALVDQLIRRRAAY